MLSFTSKFQTLLCASYLSVICCCRANGWKLSDPRPHPFIISQLSPGGQEPSAAELGALPGSHQATVKVVEEPASELPQAAASSFLWGVRKAWHFAGRWLEATLTRVLELPAAPATWASSAWFADSVKTGRGASLGGTSKTES